MKLVFRLFVAVLLLGVLATPASAQDASKRMSRLFTSPNQATNSDFAFWGNYAFSGYYRSEALSQGGVRIFDIANPAAPQLVKDIQCDGLQADPIVWDRNGNGVADLLLVAVDRTMDSPECGAPRSYRTDAQGNRVRFDENPTGWEGVRVFELSDNPANPFQTVTQVDAQYTDCGAHTITAWTGFAEDPVDPRLIVYVSSYPLRPGPTCGQTGSTATPPYQNTNNPYDDDKVVNDPLHRQIQVLSVPLNNPANTTEIAHPEISYPGDPDGQIDWCERSVTGSQRDQAGQLPACPGTLEPAAVACHDIVTHMEHNLAGAACAEQGQVWNVDPDTGIPDTQHPVLIGDDELSSGGPDRPGTEPIDVFMPGAVDFFHSVMFNNDGTVVNWVDESFGRGCPPMTEWRERAWHPASRQETGAMFFTDLDGNFLSRFQVGDLRPRSELDSTGFELEYCSAHMGMAVMGIKKDLLVNAWYTGGTDVIDFSNPTRLKEIAYYDPLSPTGTWSAYPYTGPMFKTGPGIPVYASDGVEINALSRGMEVYRAIVQKPSKKNLVDHLNPQTMDMEMMAGGGRGDDDDDDDDDRGKGRGRGHDRDDD
jgi:hypothetical protein